MINLTNIAAVCAAALVYSPAALAAEGAAEQRTAIAALCTAQVPLDASGCACFTERAMDELDAGERAYLILMSTRPEEAQRADAATRSDREEVAEFLEETPTECGATPPPEPRTDGGMQSTPGFQVN
jgi:hypothetical protein